MEIICKTIEKLFTFPKLGVIVDTTRWMEIEELQVEFKRFFSCASHGKMNVQCSAFCIHIFRMGFFIFKYTFFTFTFCNSNKLRAHKMYHKIIMPIQ